MSGRLAGKLALVTGAGAGIGAAIARRFRAEGASLFVNDLDPARAERVAREVGGRAIIADVADADAVRRMFESLRETEGRLDVLVNNAGIAGHESNPERAQRFVERAVKQMQERTSAGKVATHNHGTLETSEECDPASAQSQCGGHACTSTCACTNYCGDGRLGGLEQCDDGNAAAGDGCRADCTAELCGDGVLDASEQCDDGNDDPADKCTNTCAVVDLDAFCAIPLPDALRELLAPLA